MNISTLKSKLKTKFKLNRKKVIIFLSILILVCFSFRIGLFTIPYQYNSWIFKSNFSCFNDISEYLSENPDKEFKTFDLSFGENSVKSNYIMFVGGFSRIYSVKNENDTTIIFVSSNSFTRKNSIHSLVYSTVKPANEYYSGYTVRYKELRENWWYGYYDSKVLG